MANAVRTKLQRISGEYSAKVEEMRKLQASLRKPFVTDAEAKVINTKIKKLDAERLKINSEYTNLSKLAKTAEEYIDINKKLKELDASIKKAEQRGESTTAFKQQRTGATNRLKTISGEVEKYFPEIKVTPPAITTLHLLALLVLRPTGTKPTGPTVTTKPTGPTTDTKPTGPTTGTTNWTNYKANRSYWLLALRHLTSRHFLRRQSSGMTYLITFSTQSLDLATFLSRQLTKSGITRSFLLQHVAQLGGKRTHQTYVHALLTVLSTTNLKQLVKM
jgi:hypothetical protein